MSDERTIFFSIPIINKHRRLTHTVLSYSVLNEENELRKQTLSAAPQLRKLKVEMLREPKLYIALGKEASFAPPSSSSDGRLEFVSRVLSHAKEDERCGLKDACHDEILRRAEDLDAQQFYVFPNDYRPATQLGHIPSELALSLVRHSPCADGSRAADPFVAWDGGLSLQLAYREVQQVIIKAVTCGPFVINVNQHAIGEDQKAIKTGSVLIPALF